MFEQGHVFASLITDGPAVVFGRVEEGMQVVKAIEAVGTQAGKPKKRVTVVDSGELPSKRMILKRLREEKEELANLKKDPIAVGFSVTYAVQALPYTIALRSADHICMQTRATLPHEASTTQGDIFSARKSVSVAIIAQLSKKICFHLFVTGLIHKKASFHP